MDQQLWVQLNDSTSVMRVPNGMVVNVYGNLTFVPGHGDELDSWVAQALEKVQDAAKK